MTVKILRGIASNGVNYFIQIYACSIGVFKATLDHRPSKIARIKEISRTEVQQLPMTTPYYVTTCFRLFCFIYNQCFMKKLFQIRDNSYALSKNRETWFYVSNEKFFFASGGILYLSIFFFF